MKYGGKGIVAGREAGTGAVRVVAAGLLAGLFLVFLMVAEGQAAQNQIQMLDASNDPEAIEDGVAALGDKDIVQAWLTGPVTRYPHFVLGANYEASGIRVRLKDGRVETLMLDGGFVFEDRVARLADLDGDGRDEVIQVMTSLEQGASLAVFSMVQGRLALRTRTDFIGRSSRWLNPAGIADYDGDGVLDIALVQMPHLVKRLELWTLEDGDLVRTMEKDGYSNHMIGSPYLGLAASADFNGDGITDLAILSGDYSSVRLLSFASGEIEEFGNYPLGGRAEKNFVLEKTGDGWRLRVPLARGEDFVVDISPRD